MQSLYNQKSYVKQGTISAIIQTTKSKPTIVTIIIFLGIPKQLIIIATRGVSINKQATDQFRSAMHLLRHRRSFPRFEISLVGIYDAT